MNLLHNGRYADLQLIAAGYEKCNIPLIKFDGTNILPYSTNGADDMGIYLFI
jgi:hypothetical protein